MSIKTKMQSLIEAANAETGKGDTDLTAAVQSLISESGDSGIWYPAVDGDGTISWARSTSETAPAPTNIRGPKGDTGDTGPAGSTGPAGAAGAAGKSAYQYAVEGGYTGTETEFAAKLAQEQLTGTTGTLTPTQVYDAVSVGIPVKVQYFDGTYGSLSFTAFNVAESFAVIVSQTIIYANGGYILAELIGDKTNSIWSTMFTTLAEKKDIPTVPSSLKNPNALTIKIGSTTVTYDGSTAQTVTIADGTEVSY